MSASLDQDAAGEVCAARHCLAGSPRIKRCQSIWPNHTPGSMISPCADVNLKGWEPRKFTFTKLATSYLFLFNRGLGADDAPFRSVMGKRGEFGVAPPGAATR